MADFADEDFDLDYELRRIDLGNEVNAAGVVNRRNNVVNPEANQADIAAAPAMDVDPEQVAHDVANEPEHVQPGQPPVDQLGQLAQPAQQPPAEPAQPGQPPAQPAQLPQQVQQGQPPAGPAQLQGQPPAQPAQLPQQAQQDQPPARPAQLQGQPPGQPAQHADGERRPRGNRAGRQWRKQQERATQRNMDSVAAFMLAMSKACTNAQFRNHPYRRNNNNNE